MQKWRWRLESTELRKANDEDTAEDRFSINLLGPYPQTHLLYITLKSTKNSQDL